MPDYEVIWLTRDVTKRGGGLAIFIYKTLGSDYKVERLKLDVNDMLKLKIVFQGNELCFLFPYRQPNSNLSSFLGEMGEIIKAHERDQNVVWIGDINIDVMDEIADVGEIDCDNLGRKKVFFGKFRERYENLLAVNGFEKKINTVTREELRGNKISKTCIDHIYIKTKRLLHSSYVVQEKIADHYVIGMRLYIPEVVVSGMLLNKITTFKNEKKINKSLQNVDWGQLDQIYEPDLIYEASCNIITQIYDCNTTSKQMPTHGEVENKNMKPKKKWVTVQILGDICDKNKLWNKVKQIRLNKNKDSEVESSLIKKYNKLKNKVRKDLEISKQNYLKKEIQKNKNIWDMVNKVTNNVRKKNIDETISKNFKGEENKKLAEKFNNHFKEVTINLKKKFGRKDAQAFK